MKNINKEFLIGITTIQFAFFGSTILDKIGLEIPILREVASFIYLTFIPGILILRIIGINKLTISEILLYALGISLSFLMFFGFLINTVLHTLGLTPLSEGVLFLSLSIAVATLYFLSIRTSKPFYIDYKNDTLKINHLLALSNLPLISILGAHLLNYYDNNYIILFTYSFISIIPILISIEKLPNEVLTYTVWVISISLLFSVPLSLKYISMYASDAALEYHYSKLVIESGFWDNTITGTQNTLLRITILHPIYSIVLNTELVNIFKIIHPLQYSFTPVALYIAYRKIWGNKIAFFSSFIFMSVYPFYVVLSRNTRTGIAELFIALIILTITDYKLTDMKKKILVIIFSLSVIVSHYGTTYLFIIALIISILINSFANKYISRKISNNNIISEFGFFILYLIFTFGWYIFNSQSISFAILVKFVNSFIDSVGYLFDPKTSYITYALSRDWPVSVKVSRDLLTVIVIFITVGILATTKNTIKIVESKLQGDLLILPLSFFGILIATFLPTKTLNPARVLHISLCFLSPFVLIGYTKLYKIFRKNNSNNSMKIFSIFLTVFLLINTGVVSEVMIKGDDYSPNVIITKPRALNINDPQFIYSFYNQYITDKDIFSTKWLTRSATRLSKIYMDRYSPIQSLNLIGFSSLQLRDHENKVDNKYILLFTYNVVRQVSIINNYPPETKDIHIVYPINTSDKIYTNGGGEIYHISQ